MSTDLNQLLVEQTNTTALLKRVLINFKKLPKANVTVAKTQGRLADLRELWNKVQTLHTRICCLAPEDERKALPYFVNDLFYESESAYVETADHLHDAISRLCKTDFVPANVSTDSSFRDQHGPPNLHLPRISLPKFSGHYLEWETFRNTFESLVAGHEVLTNTQKFHYLKSSLSGDAALLIANLKISDANYDAVWKMLINEYDDKQALVHAHIHSFMSLSSMKTENVSELKKLRDTLSASLAALTNLGRPVDKWDDVIIYIVSQKFSPRTRNEWNLKRSESPSTLPSYQELYDFLTFRIRGLTDLSEQSSNATNSRGTKPRSSVNSVSVLKCVNCAGNHHLNKCEDFLSKTVVQRSSIVKQLKLCFNCMRSGHFTPSCKSKGRCITCKRAHHSLLHSANFDHPPDQFLLAPTAAVGAQPTTGDSASKNASVADVQTVLPSIEPSPTVLLATAWVNLHTPEGRIFRVRALLDQGSTFSFISESLCQTMRTKRQRADLQIRCFGEKYTGRAKSRISVQLSPCSTFTPMFPLTAYVYQRITSYAASQARPASSWSHLRDLALADPNPTSNHPIHLLIGADLYGSLLLNDLRQGPIGTPTAQSTAIGWIISGPTGIDRRAEPAAAVLHLTPDTDTDMLLQKFWEDENVLQPRPPTKEEEQCLSHFAATHSRTPRGRYIVRLPFKQGPPITIGKSLPIALSQYNRSERRLQRVPDLRAQYHDFLREYEKLGHMERVEGDQAIFTPVYIHHHAVLRETSSSTKLRVVFNASCKTSDGTSLNDLLLTGPNLQADLPAIILRWRRWCYVYKADIEKMFRQILMDPRDADFQRIVWRLPDAAAILLFRLLTVTYGLASSPYLAMQVLKQLAKDDGHNFPEAAAIIGDSLYMDDTLFGGDDLEGLRSVRNQLIELMNRGGFPLRKWASNAPELLADLPADQHERVHHSIVKEDTLKVLGQSWTPSDDSFRFVLGAATTAPPTKRSILSFISKLYDPLGWAAPVVITAKIMLQEL